MRLIPALALFTGLGVAGFAQAVTVTRTDCTQVIRHQPAPDVAYSPGVDVNGDAVAPADLETGITVEPLSEINIPITIDLQERFGIPADPRLYEGEAYVGTVTHVDGRTLFNGRPLAAGGDVDLIAACREILRRKR